MVDLTLVTGIVDIGRAALPSRFARPFEAYRDALHQLLDLDVPMVVYADSRPRPGSASKDHASRRRRARRPRALSALRDHPADPRFAVLARPRRLAAGEPASAAAALQSAGHVEAVLARRAGVRQPLRHAPLRLDRRRRHPHRERRRIAAVASRRPHPASSRAVSVLFRSPGRARSTASSGRRWRTMPTSSTSSAWREAASSAGAGSSSSRRRASTTSCCGTHSSTGTWAPRRACSRFCAAAPGCSTASRCERTVCSRPFSTTWRRAA